MARMENDPEEILDTCGFADGREVPEGVGSDDTYSEELTQPEVHPIVMLSLPDTPSQHSANAESSSYDEFSAASEIVTTIASDSGQNVASNVASTDADPNKDVDLGRGKDSSVPMDSVMEPEVVSEREDARSETETENCGVLKRGAASVDPNGSELRCDSSEPKVVRGPVKVQSLQDSAIEDDERPSKMKKFDILNVLKEIAEHQKSSSSVPKRYVSVTFPRPKWWPEDYGF